jgi:hypothetical protein
LALAIGIPVGVVALIVVVALIASSSGSSNSNAVTTTTVGRTSTTGSATTSTTAQATTPQGVTPLAQLLPSDVDASVDCVHYTSPANLTALSNSLSCSPKNLSGGQIFAFQFNTPADYAAGLVALNKFKVFDSSTAGSSCPPGADSQDSIGWHNNAFPSRSGQLLECLSVGANNIQPNYIWTYPTENAIIDAQGADNSTFTALDDWWTKFAPPP